LKDDLQTLPREAGGGSRGTAAKERGVPKKENEPEEKEEAAQEKRGQRERNFLSF